MLGCKGPKPFEQPASKIRRTLGEPFLDEDTEHRVGGGRRQGIAPERRAVVAEIHGLGDRFRGEEGGHREAPAQPLSEGNHVGNDALVFRCQHRTGASESGLDLVEDEQCSGGVADLAQSRQVAIGRNVHAALALEGLHDERRARVVHRSLCGLEIVVGECAEGAPVEGVLGGDEAGAARRAMRQLQSALDGLGARADEKAPRDRIGGDRGQAFDQIELGQGVEEVRGLHEPPRLVADGLDQSRMAVADAGHPPTGGEVDELPALDVTNPRAPALGQRQGMPPHDRQEVGRFSCPNRIDRHDRLGSRLGCCAPDAELG